VHTEPPVSTLVRAVCAARIASAEAVPRASHDSERGDSGTMRAPYSPNALLVVTVYSV
jgi:hypothetical protein